MAGAQRLLFADPRPLVERLGGDFFRRLPQSAGVYLMRDGGGTVLYVGKAKNLRKRLGSYRVANPERMARRHLRLLRLVASIEVQEAANEAAALAREAELLQVLRPRFNRAGTWPTPARFLGFKLTDEALQLAVVADGAPGFHCHGPHGAGARHLRNGLVRLLWFALYPARGIAQLPVGWFDGCSEETVTLNFTASGATGGAEMAALLERLFDGQPEPFIGWILSRMRPEMPQFEKAVVEADLEFVGERFGE